MERELAEWHRRLTSAKNARRAKSEESERVLASQRQHIEDERKLNKHMQKQLSIDVEVRVRACAVQCDVRYCTLHSPVHQLHPSIVFFLSSSKKPSAHIHVLIIRNSVFLLQC